MQSLPSTNAMANRAHHLTLADLGQNAGDRLALGVCKPELLLAFDVIEVHGAWRELASAVCARLVAMLVEDLPDLVSRLTATSTDALLSNPTLDPLLVVLALALSTMRLKSIPLLTEGGLALDLLASTTALHLKREYTSSIPQEGLAPSACRFTRGSKARLPARGKPLPSRESHPSLRVQSAASVLLDQRASYSTAQRVAL